MPGQTWDKSDSDQHPLRRTCALMGVEFSSDAQFIWDAEEWLGRRTDSIELTFIPIAQNKCISRVSGDGWHGESDYLPLALAAAIQSFHTARCLCVGRCSCKEIPSKHGT